MNELVGEREGSERGFAFIDREGGRHTKSMGLAMPRLEKQNVYIQDQGSNLLNDYIEKI